MSTDVEICNEALALVGANRITALADDTAEGGACTTFYETTKDSTLEDYPWRFARKRISLAKASTTPEYGFAQEYDLPADFLYLYEIDGLGIVVDAFLPESNSGNNDWQIEGKKLLYSGGDEIKITYVHKADEGLFTPSFHKCLAANLAVELAPTLTESSTKMKDMKALYFERLRSAQGLNGLQGRSRKLQSAGRLRTSRQHYG